VIFGFAIGIRTEMTILIRDFMGSAVWSIRRDMLNQVLEGWVTGA
jgi:hypothetical protein